MDGENRFKSILMIACTEKAWKLAGRTRDLYAAAHPGTVIGAAVKCRALPDISMKESLLEYVGKRFREVDAIVFFAASGIAVRTIAPFVKDKYKDPAVLVIDETGRFSISLLSGHVGGANELCLEIADMIGAEPVITTATDREERFSVDSFAVKHHLRISDRKTAKEISAKVVRGDVVRIFVASGCGMKDDAAPENMAGSSRTDERASADVLIDVRKRPEDRPDALYLIPKTVSVGVGCRRGKPEEDLYRAVSDVLEKNGIFPEAVSSLASIDLKEDEPGLIALAERLGVPLRTFSADELNAAEGTFTASEFVRSVTGVDCVSERAAVYASGGGTLIVSKQKYEGVTVAAAVGAKIGDQE